MKKKAIIKFNGGKGAFLCSGCSVVIKTGEDFTEEERRFARGESDYLSPLYCDKCRIRTFK